MAKKETASSGTKTERKIPLMRKITARNVMEQPIKNIAKDYEVGGEVHLFDVVGIVYRCRAVSTQYGDSVGFKGKFFVKRNDGKQWEGGEFFAPGTLEDDILTAFQARPEGSSQIEFAARISIQIDEDAQTGYVFISEPLIEAATSNQLAMLAEKAFGKAVPELGSAKK